MLAEVEGLAVDALVADADDAVLVFAVGADDPVVDQLAVHLRLFGRVLAEDLSPRLHLRLQNLLVFNRLFLLLLLLLALLLFEEFLLLEVLLEKQFYLLAQNGVVDLHPVNGSV